MPKYARRSGTSRPSPRYSTDLETRFGAVFASGGTMAGAKALARSIRLRTERALALFFEALAQKLNQLVNSLQ